MIDHSKRIPVADEYVHALGRATYNFAYLEWSIIWLGEALQKGFIESAKKLTAGKIAKQFISICDKIPKTVPQQTKLVKLAERFGELVVERDKLIHGNPYTAVGGEQRLRYDGRHGLEDWTISMMKEFSSNLAQASYIASELLYSGLYQDYLGSLGHPPISPDK